MTQLFHQPQRDRDVNHFAAKLVKSFGACAMRPKVLTTFATEY